MEIEKVNAVEGAGAGVSKTMQASEEAHATGRYKVTCVGADGQVKWEESIENLVTTVGKNDLLDKYLAGSTYTAAWYLGLVDGGTTPSYSAADTLASHAGWSEFLAYTYSASSSNRGTVAFSAASGGSKSTSAAVSFAITGSGTVAGCLLTTTQARNTASNGGAGILYSVGAFTGGNKTVANGDTLNVTYQASV